MAKILFVHGMRMHAEEHEKNLLSEWSVALQSALARTAWGRAHPDAIPGADKLSIAYWGALFRWPDLATEHRLTKGFDMAALVREVVLGTDAWASYSEDGRPNNEVATVFDKLVQQAAIYMHNGPVYRSAPDVGEGAFFQVQAIMRKQLAQAPNLVIAHSLGTVIAYEALCRYPHSVDTLVTVGSPMAAPKLILQPLRERLDTLLGHPVDQPPPWPGVRRWINIASHSDAVVVPVERLAPIFGSKVEDVEVHHGSIWSATETHKFVTYLGENHELAVKLAAVIQEIDDRERSSVTAAP